jgi:hypothetical protein
LTGGTITTSGTCAIDTAYGGPKLLNTLTASNSATLSDTTSFTNAFNEYDIVFENIVPATNAVACQLQVNSGGVQATNYSTNALRFTSTTGFDNPTTYIPCGPTAAATFNGAAELARHFVFTIHRKQFLRNSGLVYFLTL